jgi:hypothetical protein
VPEHAIAIRQFKRWSEIADLKRPISQSGLDQFLGKAIDYGQALCGNHGAQLGGERVELIVERQEIW